MHDAALAEPSASFAMLALEVIQAKHFRAQAPPLGPRVEPVLLPRRKKSRKLRQSGGRYAGSRLLNTHGLSHPGKNKKTETDKHPLSRGFIGSGLPDTGQQQSSRRTGVCTSGKTAAAEDCAYPVGSPEGDCAIHAAGSPGTSQIHRSLETVYRIFDPFATLFAPFLHSVTKYPIVYK